MKKIILITMLICGTIHAQRPISQWIFRGVMREKPRIVFLALHNNLSVAYEAMNCGLYMAWDGGMQDGNATYSHQDGGNHGSTIYASGSILYKQSTANSVSENPPNETRGKTHPTPNTDPVVVWSVRNGNASVASTTNFLGYVIDKGTQTATLKFEIKVGNSIINVEETPDYVNQGGKTSITRKFKVTGLPAGFSLRLKLDGSNINTGNGTLSEVWTGTGSGQVQNNEYIQSSDGETTVTGIWG